MKSFEYLRINRMVFLKSVNKDRYSQQYKRKSRTSNSVKAVRKKKRESHPCSWSKYSNADKFLRKTENPRNESMFE